jgi:hypothetical protein
MRIPPSISKNRGVYGGFGRHGFACIHDAGVREFSTTAAPGLLRILCRNIITERLAVDLGCGRGRWANTLERVRRPPSDEVTRSGSSRVMNPLGKPGAIVPLCLCVPAALRRVSFRKPAGNVPPSRTRSCSGPRLDRSGRDRRPLVEHPYAACGVLPKDQRLLTQRRTPTDVRPKCRGEVGGQIVKRSRRLRIPAGIARYIARKP